jgi:hypothetical protein
MVAAAGSFEHLTVNPSCLHRLADGCYRREKFYPPYVEAFGPLLKGFKPHGCPFFALHIGAHELPAYLFFACEDTEAFLSIQF